MIAGAFGDESYASAYPATQQIYLEKQLQIDPATKKLSEMDVGMGVIINFEECEYIETVPLVLDEGLGTPGRPRRWPWHK